MIESASGVTPLGKPFVTLHWGNEAAQMTPDEAREFALTVLETAEAAEMDAAVFDWLGAVVEPGPEALSRRARLLAAFRLHRPRVRAKGEAR